MSSDAGRLSQNLCACKKSQFIVRNYKSEWHNRQHTFRHRISQHKTTSTSILYTGLKVKGNNKSKTKIPSPHRHNQMICANYFCQGAIFCGSTKMKPPFLAFQQTKPV